MLKVALRGLLSPRWILMWISVSSFALASPALGQIGCGKGKTRDPKVCKGAKRDVRGCCKIPKRKKRKRRAKKKACLPGQVKTAKTKNHCCYPGQYWSRRKSKCMGAPECPSSLGMVKTGSGCGCPEGQVIDQYTNGHCCWEGQEWVDGEGCMGELSAAQRGLQEKLVEAERARIAREAERARIAREAEQKRAREGAARAKRVGMRFIKIPSGSFASGAGRYAGLSVRAFELSESEVTMGQYRQCVSAGVCTKPDTGGYKNACTWGKSGYEDHPINCVDWGQARTFARWVGGELPTEAEWEYAARGGGRAVKYPWGDSKATCRYAVMDDGGEGCGRTSTWAVCSKRQGDTPQGLCDMAGNVYEWVLDEYQRSGLPADGNAHVGSLTTCSPRCDKGSPRRVYRGGSWHNRASILRVARRYLHGSSGARGIHLGFRVRRTLP